MSFNSTDDLSDDVVDDSDEDGSFDVSTINDEDNSSDVSTINDVIDQTDSETNVTSNTDTDLNKFPRTVDMSYRNQSVDIDEDDDTNEDGDSSLSEKGKDDSEILIRKKNRVFTINSDSEEELNQKQTAKFMTELTLPTNGNEEKEQQLDLNKFPRTVDMSYRNQSVDIDEDDDTNEDGDSSLSEKGKDYSEILIRKKNRVFTINSDSEEELNQEQTAKSMTELTLPTNGNEEKEQQLDLDKFPKKVDMSYRNQTVDIGGDDEDTNEDGDSSLSEKDTETNKSTINSSKDYTNKNAHDGSAAHYDDKKLEDDEKLFKIQNLLSSTIIGEESSGKRVSTFDPSKILGRDSSNIIKSSSPSPKHQEVINISDGEEKENIPDMKIVTNEETKNIVSKAVYSYQKDKVLKAKFDMQRAKNLLQTLNLQSLPDKGRMLQIRFENAQRIVKEEEGKLDFMICDKSEPIVTAPKPIPWLELAAESAAVQPKTFGKQAMATHNLQKALTMDRLQHLHNSLKTCPDEKVLGEPPKGLKVELMSHQKQALAWLLWREKQKPSGGILADDMGLGKTLTMISLILKIIQQEEENEDLDNSNNDERCKYKYKGGTLVICPGSLLSQWEGEVIKRVKRGLITSEIYHGPRREESAKRLSRFDMVITTYAIVMNEAEKSTPLFKTKWKRIILDEAHQVRNYKSQTSEAVCKLAAYSRWVLTGTPIHNKELDLYALLKFLRCSPFDDLTVFKKWISSKATGGQDRLNTVMSSLMLRRTKAQLQFQGSLMTLPERQWEIISIEMDSSEKDVYEKVLLFSQSLLYQYLHQGVEKKQDAMNDQYFNDKNNQYYKMYQKIKSTRRIKTVAQHEILVLLLRLRQICCHPSLIHEMLEKGEVDMMDNDNNDTALNLLEQLRNLNINDENQEQKSDSFSIEGAEGAEEPVGLAEATRSVFNPSNPIFERNRKSSKVRKAIELIEENILPKNDKCIIVSQWTGFLTIIAEHLEKANVPYLELTGKIPVNKRSEIISDFNDENSKKKVLLLSLTAGGVGLNLVGANHLLLLDIHWNPQLEMQAQDRIYRVGQLKPVFIYKLMTVNTIEERINQVQDKKKALAEAVLTGAKLPQNKLSLDDLRMIFNM